MKKITINEFNLLLKNTYIFEDYEIGDEILTRQIFIQHGVTFIACKLNSLMFITLDNNEAINLHECEVINCSLPENINSYNCLFKYTKFPHSLKMSFYKPKFFKPSFPAPAIMLLNYWKHNFSNELTQELMIYDCANHPNPELFDKWASDPNRPCPYKLPNLETTFNVARNAIFIEDWSLWKLEFKNRQPKTSLWLFNKILEEIDALIKE